MGSVDQAKDLVKFHSNYPPTVNGEQLVFSVSSAFNFLQVEEKHFQCPVFPAYEKYRKSQCQTFGYYWEKYLSLEKLPSHKHSERCQHLFIFFLHAGKSLLAGRWGFCVTAGPYESIPSLWRCTVQYLEKRLFSLLIKSLHTLMSPQSSRVVSFTPAPSGEDGKSDLINIIKRFGPPLYTLFLPSMVRLSPFKKLYRRGRQFLCFS